MTRLVLISSGNDDWLRDARCRVHVEHVISTETDAVQSIENSLEAFDIESIELISHSISEPEDQRYRLKIQHWLVDDSAFQGSGLDRVLANHRRPPLYIVGCQTGDTIARPTLQAISRTLGVQVYGATRVVGLYDLDENGALLRRDELFESARSEGPRVPYAINGQALIRAGAQVDSFGPHIRRTLLADLSAASGIQVNDVLNHLQPAIYYEFPGMLTMPTSQVPLRDDGGAEVGRIDELFSGRLVRIVRRRPGGPRGREYIFTVGSQWRPGLRPLLPRS